MASSYEQTVDENVFTLGNLQLNLDNFRLAVDGEIMDITYLETELLRLLCLRPNAVITYEELTNLLWQRTNRASARHLNVLIHRLRAKLAGSYPYSIETVRGRGYGLLRARETEFAFAGPRAATESPAFTSSPRRTEAGP